MTNKPNINLYDHLKAAVEEFIWQMKGDQHHICGQYNPDFCDKQEKRLHTTLLNTITLTLQAIEEAGPGDHTNIALLPVKEEYANGHNTANHHWRTALREMREGLEGNNEGV